MTSLPNIVIIIYQQNVFTTIQECITLGIPTFFKINTDGNSDFINIPILANDDTRASIC
jgi:ribosomal protein S2